MNKYFTVERYCSNYNIYLSYTFISIIEKKCSILSREAGIDIVEFEDANFRDINLYRKDIIDDALKLFNEAFRLYLNQNQGVSKWKN